MRFVGLAMPAVIPVATAVLGGARGFVLLALAVSRTIAIFFTLPRITCSKLRPVRDAGGTHVLAGTLAVVAVGRAPAKTFSASPVAETDPATLAKYQPCDESWAGRPLELTGAVLTFADEFVRRSITGPKGNGPWYAPIHRRLRQGEVPAAVSHRRPLHLRRWRPDHPLGEAGGRCWTSGIFQSVNAKGEGLAQRYGYFEMRAKFPKGNGAWPAFWLKTGNQFTDRSETRAEIDIIEVYGANDWSGYHATVHLWPAHSPRPEQLQKHWWKGCYERVLADMFDGNWHLYGGEVGPEWS